MCEADLTRLGSADDISEGMRAMIRSGRHDEAEATLEDLFARHPSGIGELCLALPADAVEIRGWDDLECRIRAVSAESGPITAVGVDLTSQTAGRDEHGWSIQGLETSYYSDEPFCFSRSSSDDILANSGPDGSAWQGEFADIDRILTVHGLNALNERLAAEQGSAETSVLLAEWFRHLRFHQAARRGLATRREGLPLLAGTNEVGPWIEAVYFPVRVLSVAGPSAAVRDAEEERKAEAHLRQTEKDITLLRGTRARLAKLRKDSAVEYQAALDGVNGARRYEDRHFRHSPAMKQFGYCDTLSEAEFELYVQAYREQQEAYRTRSPLPTAKPVAAPGGAMHSARNLLRRLIDRDG